MEYVKSGQGKRNSQRRERATREAGEKNGRVGCRRVGKRGFQGGNGHMCLVQVSARGIKMESFLWNLQEKGCLSWQ